MDVLMRRLNKQVLCQTYSWCRHCLTVRHASGTKRRHLQREARKQEVIQYQGVNTKPAERVYVWGYAATGALGVRSYLRPERNQCLVTEQHRPARLRFMDENDFVVNDVACGYGFTLFAAKQHNRFVVMASGINTDSQLGFHEYPKNTGRVLDYIIEPTVVSIPQMSDDTEKSKSYIKLAAGRAHSVFVTTHGVFAQGNNACGQCGRPAVEGEIFSHVSNIQKIDCLPDNVTKVVCGQDHTMFLTDTGSVYSCGLGADGQTGIETFKSVGIPTLVKGDIDGVKIIDIACKADCVLALSHSGDVFGWGNSEYSQLSVITNETQVNTPKLLPFGKYGKIVKVASGGSICAMLNDEGHVYVWGFGIVGKGPEVTMLKDPSRLPPPLFGCNELTPDVKVIDVKCGMAHYAALTDTGDVYTWGNGRYGCLGLQKTMVQNFPLKVAMPAFAHRIECGVDHMVTLCRSFS